MCFGTKTFQRHPGVIFKERVQESRQGVLPLSSEQVEASLI